MNGWLLWCLKGCSGNYVVCAKLITLVILKKSPLSPTEEKKSSTHPKNKFLFFSHKKLTFVRNLIWFLILNDERLMRAIKEPIKKLWKKKKKDPPPLAFQVIIPKTWQSENRRHHILTRRWRNQEWRETTSIGKLPSTTRQIPRQFSTTFVEVLRLAGQSGKAVFSVFCFYVFGLLSGVERSKISWVVLMRC